MPIKIAPLCLALFLQACASSPSPDRRFVHTVEPAHQTSAAYHWLDIILEASARDVDRVGARPTILSRQMLVPLQAMYDAWSAYDGKAAGVLMPEELRRPESERNLGNKQTAIAYAAYRALLYVFPEDGEWLTKQMRAKGFDPEDQSLDPSRPQGIGNRAAQMVIAYRRVDGSNQEGKKSGAKAPPYADYTGYKPVNGPGQVKNPDRWGPLPFVNASGKTEYVGFLTPHWYKVKPFALRTSAQFRPPPPPLVGDEWLKKEVEELVRFNATLTPEQKALVEFMRDGPRSTGQSGHWLRFAQDVSRRDRHDIDQDIKLFFAVSAVAFDAFIASWEAKRHYDTSRPWHLVRHYYKGQTIRGWRGPGQGVGPVRAEKWLPYSPLAFLTPPFPGYVSGHSTVSAAAAKVLELFTGSDRFGFKEIRKAGAITEDEFSCQQIQSQYGIETKGDAPSNCVAVLDLPTFTATAEMAGVSRIMGAYHIRTDNTEGLVLGRRVAEWSWPIYDAYFNGDRARIPELISPPLNLVER